MPAYNSEKYLADAIHSITRQTYSAVEVIIVDSDSTDMTPHIVERLAARDPRVRLLRDSRTGIVDSRNRGAALAQGEYLAWLDADDVALPGRLQRQVQFLDAHPDVVAVGGTIVVTDEHLRELLRVTYPTTSARIASALPEGNVLAMSATTMRLSAYREVNGFRAAFKQGAEDYDLWLRLSERHPLGNLPDVVAYYRTHSHQVSASGVDRFVIPTVAAQLSAKARIEGRPDPYGNVDRFTYEWFIRTEPDRFEVDEAILRAAAGQAVYLALIGQPATSRDLLLWAKRTARSGRSRRATRARVHAAESVTAWRQQHRTAALWPATQAAVLDPLRFVGLLSRWAGAWRKRASRLP
jgi:glycosyltransferase involved in cell wall biosynthesis